MSQVAVVGCGYVGLTTGACLAHLGHEVVCADIVAEKVDQLNNGQIPIVEEGLEELVAAGLSAGRLRFVLGAAEAVADAEFVFLCLPTPEREDGSADLSSLASAAREIGPRLSAGAVVVNKSTVPVGSVNLVQELVGRQDVAVVSNPEFLREGSAVDDWLRPDRIVIGGQDRKAVLRLANLFAAIDAPLVLTDAASAETIKYACNAFLATKISFVNAVANVCEAVGADIDEVVRGIGLDRRIGPQALKPGPGWGGSCLPKDTRALVSMAAIAGYDFMLLRGVIEANADQHDVVFDKIVRMAGGSLAGRSVAVWGLAFKAGTDDLRNSPAVRISERIQSAGAQVRAFDPGVSKPLPGIEVVDDLYVACDQADVLVVLTEWPEFTLADFDKVRRMMRSPRIVDARNLLDPAAVYRVGFSYEGIGRPWTVSVADDRLLSSGDSASAGNLGGNHGESESFPARTDDEGVAALRGGGGRSQGRFWPA